MKRLILLFNILILIIFLFIQGKAIFTLIQDKMVIKVQSISDPLAVSSNVETKGTININTLFHILYDKNKNIRVMNLVFNDNRTLVEAEIETDGDIHHIQKIIEEMKKDKAFVGIKRYIENEKGTKKIYLIFNLKG